MWQRRWVVGATLASAFTAPLLLNACQRHEAAAVPPPPLDLFVQSDGDLLVFTPTALSCPARARVRLTFFHAGKFLSLEHNWVLIMPHSFDAVTKAALAAGEQNGWVPKGDAHVLAATALCGKGQTAVVEFTAPAPGDYPFICSNPGHAQSMWGVLHVTAT
jgi:azurin